MTQKLFLSYKREDNKDGFVEKLYKALIDKGYDVWWDMERMPANQSFLVEIRNAIDEHERLILVGSKAAYESDYVKVEYEYALSPGICKPVHTIIRADNYSDMPPGLAQVDAPNFKDDANFDKAFTHLLRHLEDDVAPLGTIHGSRPALPAWYIERDNIMGELDNMVLSDAKKPVVVTSKKQVNALHGMGGIGKTTVANAFSERCTTRRYFPDGIFWVTLGKNPDITFQQSNIGKIFGDDPKEYLSPEKGLARLQALLSDKKVLFVLDDVWEKDHAGAFRIQGNFTRTLITSRQQDLVVQIAALSAEVDKLTPEEGLRLFDARLNRQATARKHEAIEQQIIELLDGYTLAVELASAQLAKKGEDYAERLFERLQKKRATDNPFSDLEIEGDSKNDNLEISLAISYEDLTDDEQGRFRVLGVLAPNAPFTYELMQALYSDEDDSVTEDNLDVIQNMALISLDEVGSYVQHGVLRNYAQALLKREDEFEGKNISYLDHITELSEQFHQLQPEDWRGLDDIIPHVLYAGDTLTETYKENEVIEDCAFRFAYNTKNYVFNRREIGRRDWLVMGLSIAELRENQQKQALFLSELGSRDILGNKESALKLYHRALSLYREIGDKRGEGIILSGIGVVYNTLDDKQQALKYYSEALLLKQQVGNESGEATTLHNMGDVYLDTGDLDKALKYHEQALILRRKVNDKDGESYTLNSLGRTYAILGETEKALDLDRQSLAIAQSVGNKSNEASAYNNMALIYADLGDKQEALRLHLEAHSLFQEIGHTSSEATNLNNMGAIYADLGNNREAQKSYEQALSLYQKVGERTGEATSLNNIGMVYSDAGDKQQALEFYNQALSLYQEVGDKSGATIPLNNIGAIYSDAGDKQQALEFYNQALSLYQEIDDKSGEANITNIMSVVYRDDGNNNKALSYAKKALVISRLMGHRDGEATNLYNIAKAYYNLDSLDEAIQFMNECVRLEEAISHPDLDSDRALLESWKRKHDSGV